MDPRIVALKANFFFFFLMCSCNQKRKKKFGCPMLGVTQAQGLVELIPALPCTYKM
jgi:hypothetical protein